MKKIISSLLILFSLNCFSQQSLEGVVITNVQLRAEDWAWAVGSYNAQDSTGARTIRKIRAAIQTAAPQTWNTLVTVDSLPGNVVVWIYALYKDSPKGVTENMSSTIPSVINAISHPAVQYHLGVINAGKTSMYLQPRNRGKGILLDN